MPTYDYKCDACGHAFERFQSMSAAPIRKCPKCGKLKVKRLIGTGAGLIFKGSGFYITDYRDQSYKDKAKAESGSTDSGKTEKSAETSTSANGDAAKTTAKSEPAKAETSSESKSEAKPPKKGKKS